MNYPLLITLSTGFFFLLGILIYKYSNKQKELTIFGSSCAFMVIIGLILFDLLPEIIEFNSFISVIFILLGLFILKILDLFIPHHEHHHKDNDYLTKEHEEYLEHIGLVTLIALIFHNFIEGIALYSVASTSLKNGLIFALGIGFHNLPLGIEIGSIIKNKKNIRLIIILVLSSFMGGITALLFGNIPDVVTNIILSVTLGMIIHILFFELFKEVIDNRKKKETLYGIIIGVIILIIVGSL